MAALMPSILPGEMVLAAGGWMMGDGGWGMKLMVTEIPYLLCKFLCAWLGFPNLAAGKLKSILLTTPLAGTILALSAYPTNGTWIFGLGHQPYATVWQ